MGLLTILFYIVFVLAAIVLVVVILLQEGRGGGFGEALGSHGRETFGAGSRGINTFTAVTAGVFLVSALLIHIFNRMQESGTVLERVGGSVLQTDPMAPTPPPEGMEFQPPTGGE